MKLINKLLIIIIIGSLLFITLLSYITFIVTKTSLSQTIAADLAFAPAVDAAIKTALLATVLLIVFIVILFSFISRLLKPIETISKQVQSLASGDLTKRIDSKSKDELGQLALVLNTMADKMQEHYADLENKVEEKNAQLTQTLQETERIMKITLGRELKLMEYKKELSHLTGKNTLSNENSIAASLSDEQITKKAMLNIMEDLQIEKDLANKQKKILDSIITNMPIGVAINDATGKMLLINGAGINLLGRGVDPNVSHTETPEIFKVCKPDGSPYPGGELTNAIAMTQGITSTKDDLVIVQPHDKKVLVRATSAPIKDSLGNVSSVVSIFEDITKEKEIDRMKTEFISLASHQLRTPLSAIRWFSDMLAEGDAGKLTDEQQDFVNNISESTQRMIELVNSLLNISRIESGRILVDPKPTDLKELIESIVKELQVKLDEKKQTLIVSVHQDLSKINLDPKLIRQVYMNFLTNAIKYTPSGGEISVFVSRKENDVVSQVTDNGYGIPKAQQDKVFQKFFRAENIIKVETDGTGLGLYLIKAIIESSNGKIWFESEEGKGTSFFFSLPISGMKAKQGQVTLEM